MGLHKGTTPKNINDLIEKGKEYRFKRGNISWNIGKITPIEVRNKISKSKIGLVSLRKGKKYLYKKREYKVCPTCKKEFTDFPYRMKVKKYCCSTCANQNITPAKLIQREKFRNTMMPKKGRKLSDNHRKNISLAKKVTWMNPEYRIKKLSQMENNWKENSIYRSGSNSPRWLGGKSFEPYGVAFNNSLKNIIRERDVYTCQLCMLKNEFCGFSVHHIDYNKNNNEIWNLITLCNSCHMKTNFNRENWKSWFSGMIFERYKDHKMVDIYAKIPSSSNPRKGGKIRFI